MQTFAKVVLALSLILQVAPVVEAQSTASPDSTAELNIHAAIVTSGMELKPAALVEFTVQGISLQGRTWPVRTSLAGRATLVLPVGEYQLKSNVPVIVGDSSYFWDVTLRLKPGDNDIDLTQLNALVRPLFVAAGEGRRVTEDRVVFEQVKGGVFQVQSGLGSGSGFLIASHGGLIVTNDHVVRSDSRPVVQIDSVTRVEATIVARDKDADIALLRIAPGICRSCTSLSLSPEGVRDAARVGERVLAIGFPLNQEQTLTVGIVSSLRDEAIISNVNINPGNSGGPLLNLAGQVVGINTFLDAQSVGPGISGSITVAPLHRLLASVPDSLLASEPPSPRRLPVAPRDRYPTSLLRSIADTASLRAYESVIGRVAGNFHVTLHTPILLRMSDRFVSNIQRDRDRREFREGVAEEQRFLQRHRTYDWHHYLASPFSPVVLVVINPIVAETGGSRFLRAFAAAVDNSLQLQALFEPRGDVRGARIYRNGVEIEPFFGGHTPFVYYHQDQWISLADVADYGVYAIPIEAFAPEPDGAPAVVTVIVRDLKNPWFRSSVDFYGPESARMWNDFIPYLRIRDGREPIVADPRRAKRVPIRCDVATTTCRLLENAIPTPD